MTKKIIDDLSYKVIGAAIEVHKTLGPGLLESVYHRCLEQELSLQKISYKTEMTVPVLYKGLSMKTDLRCDLFVDDCLLVELKAVERVLPIHEAQLLSYMKLLRSPKGVLINFNCYNLFGEGQKTYVNELYRLLPNE